MKKKELREQLIIVNDMVLRLQEKLSLEACETTRLEQELKKGQDNYEKLWDMYSKLKKENKELEEEMRNLTTELILNMIKDKK